MDEIRTTNLVNSYKKDSSVDYIMPDLTKEDCQTNQYSDMNSIRGENVYQALNYKTVDILPIERVQREKLKNRK